MDIRNFTQFINLLNSKNAVNLHPSFQKLSNCVSNYNSICSCGSSNKEKQNKYNECNRIYREATIVANSIKPYLFLGCSDNTISFYMDNTYLVRTISR